MFGHDRLARTALASVGKDPRGDGGASSRVATPPTMDQTQHEARLQLAFEAIDVDATRRVGKREVCSHCRYVPRPPHVASAPWAVAPQPLAGGPCRDCTCSPLVCARSCMTPSSAWGFTARRTSSSPSSEKPILTRRAKTLSRGPSSASSASSCRSSPYSGRAGRRRPSQSTRSRWCARAALAPAAACLRGRVVMASH